jgi:hypothetical protein
MFEPLSIGRGTAHPRSITCGIWQPQKHAPARRNHYVPRGLSSPMFILSDDRREESKDRIG